MQVRVAADGLVEDAEVVAGGLEMPLLLDFEDRVQGGGGRCQCGDARDIGRDVSVDRPTDCRPDAPFSNAGLVRSLGGVGDIKHAGAQASDTLLWSPNIRRWARGIAVEGETSTSLPINESSIRLTPEIVVASRTIECSSSVESMRQSW